MGLPAVVKPFTRTEVIETYGNECFYCGGDFEELDHFVPVALGGEHSIVNVRPSCSPCNRAKGDHAYHQRRRNRRKR